MMSKYYTSVTVDNKNLEKKHIFLIENINHTNYELLLKYYYKNSDLKKKSKELNLPVSGNKKTLIYNIYNNLMLYNKALKIQKVIKQYLFKSFIKAKGKALFNRKLCINDTDFFTMERIDDIEENQFISYTDLSDNLEYGFNIMSVFNLYKNKMYMNPYTRTELPTYLDNNMKKIHKLSKIFNNNNKPTVFLNKEDENENTNTIESNFISIFHYINNLGNYANYEWMYELSKPQYLRFIRELKDIWNYRLQISITTKKEIYNPSGNPFIGISYKTLFNKSIKEIKENILLLTERFVKSGTSDDYKRLGASYILMALTLVSPRAAQGLPWLYQSVA